METPCWRSFAPQPTCLGIPLTAGAIPRRHVRFTLFRNKAVKEMAEKAGVSMLDLMDYGGDVPAMGNDALSMALQLLRAE